MKLLGLLGYPLSHSLSATMINQVARKKGWLCSYHPFAVPADRIADFISAVKLLPVAGFNVTIPYKQVIIPYCDELRPAVREIGATNAVLYDQGKLIAANTDAVGFLAGIKEILPAATQVTTALILGAGGAARAVAYALTTIGCRRIIIAAPNSEEEKQWRRDWSTSVHLAKLEFCALALSALQPMVPEVDMVVQATPVGTWPKVDESLPFPFTQLTTAHLVFDLIYNPPETAFLQSARQAGAKTQNGLTMLAAQAAQFLKLLGFATEPAELLQALQPKPDSAERC